MLLFFQKFCFHHFVGYWLNFSLTLFDCEFYSFVTTIVPLTYIGNHKVGTVNKLLKIFQCTNAKKFLQIIVPVMRLHCSSSMVITVQGRPSLACPLMVQRWFIDVELKLLKKSFKWKADMLTFKKVVIHAKLIPPENIKNVVEIN